MSKYDDLYQMMDDISSSIISNVKDETERVIKRVMKKQAQRVRTSRGRGRYKRGQEGIDDEGTFYVNITPQGADLTFYASYHAKPQDSIFGQKYMSSHGYNHLSYDDTYATWINDGQWFDVYSFLKADKEDREYKDDFYREPIPFYDDFEDEITSDAVINSIIRNVQRFYK